MKIIILIITLLSGGLLFAEDRTPYFRCETNFHSPEDMGYVYYQLTGEIITGNSRSSGELSVIKNIFKWTHVPTEIMFKGPVTYFLQYWDGVLIVHENGKTIFKTERNSLHKKHFNGTLYVDGEEVQLGCESHLEKLVLMRLAIF